MTDNAAPYTNQGQEELSLHPFHYLSPQTEKEYRLPTKNRLTIRSVPDHILEGLTTLAERNGRSLEDEGRFALLGSVYPSLLEVERSQRRQGIAARLIGSLEALNVERQTAGLPTFRPSHVAEAAGETHVDPVEGWFSGLAEPSLAQVKVLAGFLKVEPTWLQHGATTTHEP